MKIHTYGFVKLCIFRTLLVLSLTSQTMSLLNSTVAPDGTTAPSGSNASSSTKSPSTSPIKFSSTSPTSDSTLHPSSPPTSSSKPTLSPTSNPTPSPTTSSKPTYKGCRPKDIEINYYCPFDRYCEFSYYPLEKQTEFTNKIGYTQRTWDMFGRAEVESMSFFTLTPNQQEGLSDIGFYEENHDCCLNHYDDYAWSDFDPDEGFQVIIDALGVLGYDQNMWDNGIVAESDDYYWDDLDEDLQYAAMELCYSRETWNLIPLPRWPIDADLPGAFPYESGSPSVSMPPTEKPTFSLSESVASTAFGIHLSAKLSILLGVITVITVTTS